MKVNRSLLPEKRLVIDRISGTVTTEELWANLVSLFDNPDYECGFAGVYDMRESTSHIKHDMFMDFVKRVAESDEFGKSKWAIIVNEPLLTAYAAIFQKYVSDDVMLRLFSTEVAAMAYIGADPDLI